MLERGDQLVDRLRAEGVAHLGPVEGDADDAGVHGAVVGEVGEVEALDRLPTRELSKISETSSRALMRPNLSGTRASRAGSPGSFGTTRSRLVAPAPTSRTGTAASGWRAGVGVLVGWCRTRRADPGDRLRDLPAACAEPSGPLRARRLLARAAGTAACRSTGATAARAAAGAAGCRPRRHPRCRPDAAPPPPPPTPLPRRRATGCRRAAGRLVAAGRGRARHRAGPPSSRSPRSVTPGRPPVPPSGFPPWNTPWATANRRAGPAGPAATDDGRSRGARADEQPAQTSASRQQEAASGCAG